MGNISFFSYLFTCFSFILLSGLIVRYWRKKHLSGPLLLACLVTGLWAAVLAVDALLPALPTGVGLIAELLRNACWMFLLLRLIGLQVDANQWAIRGRQWRVYFFIALGICLALIVLGPLLSVNDIRYYYQVIVCLWLVVALVGVLLIEQLFRNATPGERWSIKHLSFGLGTLFVFDFFMYSEALLFGTLDEELWQARGLVNAIITPWLAVAIARGNKWQISWQVSRQIVFHSVTLIGAGIYLFVMGLAGYLIKFAGGSWGAVLQVSFLAAAGAFLCSLLFSGTLRARIRVFLTKHFFSYHYDYRDEWLKFTQALASLNVNIAEGIIRIMAPLVSSPAGLLWANKGESGMELLAHWQMPVPESSGAGLGQLPAWLQQTDWVIDLLEWRRSPQTYDRLVLPAWLQASEQIWLIIPLVFRDRVEGVLMLKRSDIKSDINWEDRDLLKTAGRQAASHLAQHLASDALVEARQFDAFNRLSAYVAHDLKNILAQQSLIISNATRHRSNPAFVDDMIATIENSVERMQRLMEQMRSGIRTTSPSTLSVAAVLNEVIASRRGSRPQPSGDFVADGMIEADPERLGTVFNHLIQNAQEATAAHGRVVVRLTCNGDWVKIEIEDSGSGMSEEFIRTRLFRPFESTKGLTGMGVGAFESREYIRQLGGDITVSSRPGEGSIFYITIPCAPQPNAPAKLLSADSGS